MLLDGSRKLSGVVLKGFDSVDVGDMSCFVLMIDDCVLGLV